MSTKTTATEEAKEIRGLLLENKTFLENCDWAADGDTHCVTVIFDWEVVVSRIVDSGPRGPRERMRVRYGGVTVIDEVFDGWKLYEMAKAKAMGPEDALRSFRELAEMFEKSDRYMAELKENRSIESPG